MSARKLLTATTLALLGVAEARSATMECHPATQSEIAALFERWNNSLASGDPDAVADLYAPQSILLPTLSNTPRVTRDGRRDYFVTFMQNKPRGQIDSRRIQIGCNTAVDAGLYTFRFGDGREVHARYTFTYAWNGTDWWITSHHSSAMPETGGK